MEGLEITRIPYKQEVGGSSPSPPTISLRFANHWLFVVLLGFVGVCQYCARTLSDWRNMWVTPHHPRGRRPAVWRCGRVLSQHLRRLAIGRTPAHVPEACSTRTKPQYGRLVAAALGRPVECAKGATILTRNSPDRKQHKKKHAIPRRLRKWKSGAMIFTGESDPANYSQSPRLQSTRGLLLAGFGGLLLLMVAA